MHKMEKPEENHKSAWGYFSSTDDLSRWVSLPAASCKHLPALAIRVGAYLLTCAVSTKIKYKYVLHVLAF